VDSLAQSFAFCALFARAMAQTNMSANRNRIAQVNCAIFAGRHVAQWVGGRRRHDLPMTPFEPDKHKVAGVCPMGCGESLWLVGDTVMCLARECPRFRSGILGFARRAS
jgi:hypothetical protein